MKTIIASVLLIFAFSAQALNLRTLAISKERLKLIQENSSLNIGHNHVEAIANETPEHQIKAREGQPAFTTPFLSIPQMTIDRTNQNFTN